MNDTEVDERARETVIPEVLERLRVLIVAGVPVGVVIAGLGSRLAMLALRLTSPDHVRGIVSDDGFVIGRSTLGGTYNLLMLGGFVGIIGAAASRAVTPWTIGPWWFRQLTLAVGAGTVVGSMLVHGDGIDFRALKPTWFAIGLFVALPALFAILVGIAVDAVKRPDSWTATGRRRWLIPVCLLAAFPGATIVAAAAATVLIVWVPAQRVLVSPSGVSLTERFVIRSGWLIAVFVGSRALIADIQTLT